MRGLGQYFISVQARTQDFIPEPFFQGKPTPSETNYDIEDRKPLAVKMALEEGRHWTGWRVQSNLLWYGLITRIWLTNDSTPTRASGAHILHCFRLY